LQETKATAFFKYGSKGITELQESKSVLRKQETKVNIKMSGKKIRVIKKGQQKQEQNADRNANSPRETAREMVKTVTNWVNELQQKRSAETANALKFLSNPPRPSEI